MRETNVTKIIVGVFIALLLWGTFYVVPPGYRGVRVTLGNLDQSFIPSGVGLKWPLITSIHKMLIKQDTHEMTSECFSLDLQQINIKLKVLYRIPESSVVSVYRDYSGDPFDKLILPRVQEATKEVTAMKTAADIVKTREQVKISSLDKARKKIGELLIIQDLVIENVDLSKELEAAIEAKMVQEQQAEKSLFVKQQAQVDAETAVIRANGEAQAIKIQGEALKSTPQFIELKTVERWNGISPQVVAGGNGVNILFPVTKTQQ